MSTHKITKSLGRTAGWRKLLLVFAVMAVFLAIPQVTWAAQPYGSGPYGSCTFQNCPPPPVPPPTPTPTPTPVTLPNKLEVTINLEEGQTIPRDGYVITIKPKDGSNGTFKSASITIDGEDAQTIEPDETGTASWRWDPRQYPGTKVVVTITDNDGGTTTQTFNVKIATSGSNNNNGQGGSTGGGFGSGSRGNGDPTPSPSPINIVPEAVEEVIRALPPVVIRTFPYLLFLVLAAVAVVVLLQIKRELVANRKIQQAIEQEKLMLELKKNFMGLASHYLRTPATIISGGIDLVAAKVALPGETIAKLKAAAKQLSDHIKTIIMEQEAIPVSQDFQPPKHANIRIGIWLLIVAIAVGSGVFNYMAYEAGRPMPGINVISQFGVFVLVSLVLYQIDRRLVLRRKEHQMQAELLASQQRLQDSQDAFLRETATRLSADFQALQALTSQIPADETSKLLLDGVQKLSDVIAKCQTAQLVKGANSAQEPVPTNVSQLFNVTEPKLSSQISAKQLQVASPPERQVALQEPTLVQYVTRSLLDNAVAYSPQNGTITLQADDTGHNELTLAVSDQGAGIPKERQQLLFQPLSKIEGFENFNHEGMGFSLYLDKLIMEYLGGSIALQSEQGKGTSVQLQLPVGPAA